MSPDPSIERSRVEAAAGPAALLSLGLALVTLTAGGCGGAESTVAKGRADLRAVELTREAVVGEATLAYPGSPALGHNAMALGEDHLYLYDSRGDVPFYALDLETHELKGFGGWGRGPGEIPRGGPAVLSFADGRLFAHAVFGARLLVYTDDLGWRGEAKLAADDLGIGGLYAASDSSGFFVNWQPGAESSSFARRVRFATEGKRLRVVPGPEIGSYAELAGRVEGLDQLALNPMLKAGPMLVLGDRLLWASYYSSLRLGFEADGGVAQATFAPRSVPLPASMLRTETAAAEGDPMRTGSPRRAVQGALSMAADADHVYRLYSGVEVEQEQIMAARRGEGPDDLRLAEGRQVDVFDRGSGDYLHSFRLPIWATNLAVGPEHLYCLSLDPVPRLVVFEKPSFSVARETAAAARR